MKKEKNKNIAFPDFFYEPRLTGKLRLLQR